MNKRREEDDVEMDEEEEQPRRSKKNKKKRAQQDDSDAEGAEEAQEEVPEAHIDDQPISKNEAKKLHGIIGDWAAMRDGVHMPGYGFVRDLAASVAEFTEGEKGEKVSACRITMYVVQMANPIRSLSGRAHHRVADARVAGHRI